MMTWSKQLPLRMGEMVATDELDEVEAVEDEMEEVEDEVGEKDEEKEVDYWRKFWKRW